MFSALLLGLVAVALSMPESAKAEQVAWLNLPSATAVSVQAPVFGGEVRLYEAGSPASPAVVLVHGLGQRGARDWEYLIPELAQRYHVFAFDLPGFGASSGGNKLYSPDRYAQFIRALTKQHLGKSFDLIGHSMGGALSLRYAELFPEDVRHLLLVDVAGLLHRSVYVQFLSMLGLDKIPGMGRSQEADGGWLGSMIRKAFSVVEAAPNGAPAILNSAWLREKTLGGNPNRIAGMALVHQDYSRSLARIKAPAFLIWGGDDPIAPLRTGHILAKRLPNARMTVLSDSAHVPMIDNTAAFNRLVLAELARSLEESRALNVEQQRKRKRDPARSGREAVCDGERDLDFSGDYRKLTIRNCQDIRIADASIGALHIEGSRVQLVDSRVDEGVYLLGSQLFVTASDVRGAVAIKSNQSTLDIAGSLLSGSRAALQVDGKSSLFCSLCRIDSPFMQGYLHDVRRFKTGDSL